MLDYVGHGKSDKLSDDQKYDLALSLIAIGNTYPSLTLLHVAVTYVAAHPMDTLLPLHTSINQPALLQIMSSYLTLNKIIDQNNLRDIYLMKP